MHTLIINNIKVAHKDGKEIVHDVSLSVKSGELHIIMGQNGSGKSTLLNALLGQPSYTITSGAMLLDGEDITNISTEEKAKKGLFLSMQYPPEIAGVTMLSFLHQAIRLLKGEEVAVLDFYRALEEKLKKVGIDSTILKRFVNVGFSGGEKKQAEVAQLIALAPRFAFLDEIDSGVDVDALEKVFAGIEMLRKEGTAFVVVTHHGAILERMNPDFVHVMKDGKIERVGGALLAREILSKGFENK